MNYSAAFIDGASDTPFHKGKTLSWQADNPYVTANRISGGDDNQHWLCADAHAIDHAPYYYGDCASVRHLPHWATDFGLSAEEEDPMPFEERPFDILFIGSIDAAATEDCEKRIEEAPEKVRAFATSLLERMRSKPCNSLTHEALSNEDGFGLEFARHARENFCKVLMCVDLIIRSQRRMDLLRALRGLRIAVVSNDYGTFEQYLGDGLIKVGPGDFLTGLQAMRDAKIVSNNLPLYRQGATERAFNAQLSRDSPYEVLPNRKVCLG